MDCVSMWLLKLLCLAPVTRASASVQYFLAPFASEYAASLSPLLKVGSDGGDSLHGMSWIHKEIVFRSTAGKKDAAVVAIVAIGMFLGVLTLLIACWGRMLRRAIEARFASFETNILGVDVDVDSVRFNPCTGILQVYDLTVDSPKGYNAPYLLKSSEVLIEVDILSLWVSFGRECHVQKVQFRDLDIVLEKSGSSSNVQDVLNFMKGKWLQTQPSKQAKLKLIQELGNHTKLIVHQVGITDIGVKLQVDKVLTPTNMSLRFALADIFCTDFSNDHGANYADDVAAILMDSVLKSVVCNVIGKAEADACCVVFEPMTLARDTQNDSVGYSPGNENVVKAAKCCNECESQLEVGCKFCSDCGSPKISLRLLQETLQPSICTHGRSLDSPIRPVGHTGGTLEV